MYEVSPDLVEYGLQWAPDGQSVLFVTATRSSDGEVRFWSVPSAGGRAHSIELPAYTSFRSVRLSPDGTRIAVKAGEARNEVWVMKGLGDPLTIANPETSR